MVLTGERCLRLHRIMVLTLGLWPHQKPYILRIQAVFFFGLFVCLFCSQAFKFLTTSCNLDCTLKRFSYLCICCIYVLTYYAFYFNFELYKRSLQHMRLDWKIFENTDAMKIFEEYLSQTYIFIMFVLICIVTELITFVTFECRSIILDIILPMSNPRPRKIELEFYLFVDEEQHFFLYLAFEVLGVFLGFCGTCATTSFWLIVGKHCCAAYKIASCLIENMSSIQTLQIPAAEKVDMMHRNIRLSIHIHRKTWELCTDLLISYSFWLLPIIAIAVASLSCFLFRTYNAMTRLNDLYDIMTCIILLCVYVTFMFVGNLFAQSYTDHSVKILDAMYDSLWYTAPLPIQKLFLIMQKSIKCHKLVIGSIFVPSIEGFSSLMTTAVSYFTFMHAMQALSS